MQRIYKEIEREDENRSTYRQLSWYVRASFRFGLQLSFFLSLFQVLSYYIYHQNLKRVIILQRNMLHRWGGGEERRGEFHFIRKKIVVGWFCFVVIVFTFIVFGFVKVEVKGSVVLCSFFILPLCSWVDGSEAAMWSCLFFSRRWDFLGKILGLWGSGIENKRGDDDGDDNGEWGKGSESDKDGVFGEKH